MRILLSQKQKMSFDKRDIGIAVSIISSDRTILIACCAWSEKLQNDEVSPETSSG
jgi:hypothetical protein